MERQGGNSKCQFLPIWMCQGRAAGAVLLSLCPASQRHPSPGSSTWPALPWFFNHLCCPRPSSSFARHNACWKFFTHCSLHHSSGPSPGASHSHFSLRTSTCLNSHSRTVFLSHPHTVSCDLAVLEPEGREGTVFYPIALSLTKASER